MNVKGLFLCILLCLPVSARAQGFAGLGSDATGFAVPERGKTLRFPQDHGSHPAYRIEWWYLTANLKGEDGNSYGIQWTLFRSALAPRDAEGWDSPQLWMGHAGLTTPDTHFHAERLARGGIGQAGVRAAPFEAWIDDWQMTGAPGRGLDSLKLTARGDAFFYDLSLTANGPLVTHGDRGFSVKSREGQASFYYSQPFYTVSGILNLPSGPVRVTGQGWLDREWSSQPLSQSQTGWDWFSLSFDSGDKLMGFRLRDEAGNFTSGTWIGADGTAFSLPHNILRAMPLMHSDVGGRSIPTDWRIELESPRISVDISALNPRAWMDTSFPYWEGPVKIEGSHSGMGYLEMTGYD